MLDKCSICRVDGSRWNIGKSRNLSITIYIRKENIDCNRLEKARFSSNSVRFSDQYRALADRAAGFIIRRARIAARIVTQLPQRESAS